ncbi:MAG: Holliday junction branch migration protein RuvA [Candidatus Nealsonbacteria bacterium]|nr:Holliday junction branch migration protein RuvA [Candidatus Nealsonbacteria bacterium]
MIYYLKGRLGLKDDKVAVVEVGGVGYKVFCSPVTLSKISGGQEISVFTYLHLRENAAELYGFLTQNELGLFEVLNDISGVGPKTAMMLASLGSLTKLKEVIEKGELPHEIKGIGQKRAQKILLELTGKIKEIDATDDALDALITLGFPRPRAKNALSQVPGDVGNMEDRIKKALEYLGKR